MTQSTGTDIYPVVEMFASVQGEGHFLGKPATFIRLGKCNLHCSWCDTKFDEFIWTTSSELASRIQIERMPKFVVLTGGEPTLQPLTPLLHALKAIGCFIAVETNGTLPVKSKWPMVDWVSCSPKPETGYLIHKGVHPDELKYVVDEAFRVEDIAMQYLNVIPIWLQPEGFHMQESARRAYEIVRALEGLRLGIQQHKVFELQ